MAFRMFSERKEKKRKQVREKNSAIKLNSCLNFRYNLSILVSNLAEIGEEVQILRDFQFF